MFGCQQNLISLTKDLKAILEFLCSESSKLTNCGIYYARQMYFKTGKIPSRAQLHKVLGTENQNLHYKAFYSDTAQQILTTVAESFKSYMGLLRGIGFRDCNSKTQIAKLSTRWSSFSDLYRSLCPA